MIFLCALKGIKVKIVRTEGMKCWHAIPYAPKVVARCRTMLKDIVPQLIVSLLLLVASPLAATAQSHRIDTLSASVNFRQGHSNLDLGFMGNKETLDGFVKAYNSHPHKASAIHVIGYASPEGAVAVNQRLSRERAAVIARYLQANCSIPADSIVSVPIGVDWQDLFKAVQTDPNVPGREQVLNIITNAEDMAGDSHGALISQRNRLLQQLEDGRTWSYMLKHIYPYLRGAKAEVVCIVDSIPDYMKYAVTDSIPEPDGDLAQGQKPQNGGVLLRLHPKPTDLTA